MEAVRKLTVRDLLKLKQAGQKIVTVTAYDALFGRIADEAGMHLILVGDSAGNTVLGYKNTIPVTLEESLMLTAAVCRGVQHAMVIGDMPFMSYQISETEAVRNAGRYLKECGADGVKLEGGRRIQGLIARLVDSGIPVFAHVGLQPQQVLKDGGYRIHGRDESEAEGIYKDALAVQEAGAFAVVLEGVSAALAKRITSELRIPTIGIGAGACCDGQIQVITDILGLGGDFVPRHAKQFGQLGAAMKTALTDYCREVSEGTFPGEGQSSK